MDKRLLFASMLCVTAGFGVAPVACSGSNAAILGDAPDATETPDAAGTATDTGTGNDTGNGGSDTGTGTDGAPTDGGRPKKDAGATDGGVSESGTDAGPVDAAPPPYDGGPLNSCNAGNYVDRSNGGQVQRTITFPSGIPGSFTYSIPCMRVKAGQTVQFDGNFANHPLEAFGGNVPTPFTLTNTGLTQQFTFNNGGNYGFHSQNDATMIGAIQVTN
jgi:plastocyanin